MGYGWKRSCTNQVGMGPWRDRGLCQPPPPMAPPSLSPAGHHLHHGQEEQQAHLQGEPGGNGEQDSGGFPPLQGGCWWWVRGGCTAGAWQVAREVQSSARRCTESARWVQGGARGGAVWCTVGARHRATLSPCAGRRAGVQAAFPENQRQAQRHCQHPESVGACDLSPICLLLLLLLLLAPGGFCRAPQHPHARAHAASILGTVPAGHSTALCRPQLLKVQ